MRNNDRETPKDARRSKSRAITERIGSVLRILRIVGVVASVAAFLIFVFSDNWLARVMERSIRQELQEEGLSHSDMRPTPIMGFSLTAQVPIDGDPRGATLASDGSGVWIASSDGQLLLYSVAEGVVTDTLASAELPSPYDVTVAQDGRLLVADPSGVVAYVDHEGNVEPIASRASFAGGDLMPLRVAEDGETVLIINGGQPPGVLALIGEDTVARYRFANVTDLVMRDGYLYVSGGHESGLPVARLSRAGADTFIPVDTTWIWALSYWDVPFVSLDVDELGFTTIVDQEGHLVQLSPGARVILHGPSERDDLGEARSITALSAEAFLVVYERGIRTYRLNEEGTMMRDAVIAASRGDYPRAITLWEELVTREPHLSSLRRWLGGAYLALERPQEAAKYFYLASDREGFQTAVSAEAYKVRKEHLWEVWITIMGVTLVVWILDGLWSFMRDSGEEEAP